MDKFLKITGDPRANDNGDISFADDGRPPELNQDQYQILCKIQ